MFNRFRAIRRPLVSWAAGGVFAWVLGGLVPLTAFATEAAAESSASSASTPQVQASIPFANRGGILNWQVLDDSNLLIEDQHHQWYRVTLQSPAMRLAFAEQLGFDTGPSGTLERLGAIIVGGLRYTIVSLVRAEPPGKRKR
jgi:hypothetical protein